MFLEKQVGADIGAITTTNFAACRLFGQRQMSNIPYDKPPVLLSCRLHYTHDSTFVQTGMTDDKPSKQLSRPSGRLKPLCEDN